LIRSRRTLTQIQKFRWEDLAVRIDDLEKRAEDGFS
jgi:DNA replication initiation complex subunit (GINS family)